MTATTATRTIPADVAALIAQAAEHIADAEQAATPAAQRRHLDLTIACYEHIAAIYRKAAAQAV